GMKAHGTWALAALLGACSTQPADMDMGAPDEDMAQGAADLAGPVADLGGADAARRDAGGFPHGVCKPADLPTRVLGADCGCLIGTLLPGASGNDALILMSEPDRWMQGFGDYVSWPVVRPTDGRLVYHDFDTLHVWRFDRAAGQPRPPGAFKDNDDPVAI